MKEVLDYNVVPMNYNIKIKIEDDCFYGEESIQLKVMTNTKKFNFNSSGLELSDLHLYVNGVEKACDICDNENEFVDVNVEEGLCVNDTVHMTINFKGCYSKDMWGFYKSNYNGDLLFSTDFEPTNARRAFPCWDQPDMKATFNMAVQPLDGYEVLGNSSLKEVKDGVYYFNTTPKMSTYIVACISGKLIPYTVTSKRNIPISVYAHKDEVQWGEYAARVGKECLDFFEEYFDIDYPLPKLDLVTIPTFVSGAMENWGLVTFRKTSLLYAADSSSVRSKKIIAETVCHELAHMWFGNLVTMKWWNDLWLNEGFATWAASLAMNNLSKDLIDWDVWTTFISSDIETGMEHDCLESSHPIAVPVNKPSEISQIFDSISYSKGASMIKMLEGYIGAGPFKNGIRKYLKDFKYDNATTNDLWNSFPKELNVAEIMNDWINRQGFPLLEVLDQSLLSKSSSNILDISSANTDDGMLRIRQSIFLCSGKCTDDIWKIPVKIRWYGPEINEEVVLMTERDIKIQKQAPVYKLNASAFGFYRVRYQIQNMGRLFEQDLDTNDKLNIINDLFAFINARRTKAIDGIVLSELFTEEENPEILLAILSNLMVFKSVFYDSRNVNTHVDEVMSDIVCERALNVDLHDLSLPSEKMLTNKLVIRYALLCGNKEVKNKLRNAYEASKDKQCICPDYMESVFSAAANNSYEELFELGKNSTLPEEKIIALSSLASIEDPQILLHVLARYPEIEPHNSIYFFLNLTQNLRNRELILNFICDKFDDIRQYMMNDRLFQYVIERVLGRASTYHYADKVTTLLESKRGGEITMAIDKTIEKIAATLEFREYNNDLVSNKI